MKLQYTNIIAVEVTWMGSELQRTSTKDLIEELAKRQGVYKTEVAYGENYEILAYNATDVGSGRGTAGPGPAIILTIID